MTMTKGPSLVAAIIIILCYFQSLPRIVSGAKQNDGSDLEIRLPKDLKPLHYLVKLQPFINGNFSIDGYVEIIFRVENPTNKIILHIKDIITHNDTVKVQKGRSKETIGILSQAYDDERQFYIALLDSTLQADHNYIISMSYEGYLNDQLKGLYRSSYKDNEGVTRYLAVTQFQATDARMAFPCFDEPGFRANFSIEMIREQNMTTLSNMPLAISIPLTNKPGWTIDRFETSVSMSTYLVAFIVADFTLVKSNKTKYEFAVATRRNAADKVWYSLEIGPKIMAFFEDFFGLEYPLPKLHMAAAPDFSFRGMENWGLIIYRESRLLYDESVADAYSKRSVSLLISHELAHQWFGNLVTPYWWSDLWLNEGFASYVQFLGMNAVDPTQKYLDQMVISPVQEAFSRDCFETSHPISIPVENPDQIGAIFDTISYRKGASIIRMMSHFLTEATFRKALKNYLTDLSYKNAEQDDLWEYMTKYAYNDGTLSFPLSVKEIMDTWTLQMGFPVVSVARRSGGNFFLKQERFLLYKNSNSTDSHDYKWWIPITYTTSRNPDFEQTKVTEWMKPSETEKTVSFPGQDDDWVIFNLQTVGYFRVNYNKENWMALTKQLNYRNQVIHSINRAQLLDDALNLARADMLSYEIAFEILSYLDKEAEYVPLKAALNAMSYLHKMLSTSTETSAYLKKFFLSLLVPHYEKVGFEDRADRHQLSQMKGIEVLNWVCKLGHTFCIERSLELYSQWMKNPLDTKIIPLNLKTIVYCTAIAAAGGRMEWDFAWLMYTRSDDGSERDLLLKSLACSKEQEILKTYLDRAIMDNTSGIRKHDVKYIIAAVADNDIGKSIAWDFLRERWEEITSYYGTAIFTLSDIVDSVTGHLNTQDELQQLQKFRRKYKGKFLSAERSIEQAEENTKINLEWMTNSHMTINKWLKDKSYADQETGRSNTGGVSLLTFLVGIFVVLIINNMYAR